MVHAVGAGIATPILSPLPETTTCHSVLDLVKLEKPIISGAICAKKKMFCFDRLNTTREK
jgi:hypothetical protein